MEGPEVLLQPKKKGVFRSTSDVVRRKLSQVVRIKKESHVIWIDDGGKVWAKSRWERV